MAEPTIPTDPDLADEIVATVKRFVQKDVLPVVSELERTDTYPAELVATMAELGLFACAVPEEFGGLALDTVTYAKVIEELSAGWMSLSGVLNTHTMVVKLLVRHGTLEQQEHFLPRMATGTPRGALSLSEPDAGSDTNAIACKATRDGDEFVIDGTKMWVTNGERAGVVALAARASEGITCFILEKDPGPMFGGIRVSSTIGKLGYKGIETVEMIYAGHRLPVSAVLGGPDAGLGRGLPQMLGTLELGRVNIAARATGVARAAYEAALAYAQQRETFGVPIAKHQAIAFKLADMATRVEAARLLTKAAAERIDRGERADVEAGMAKLFASEAALENATEAMRVLGGYGYTTDFPVERYFRDAPLMIIGEGTNEIQRLVIARGLLTRASAADGRD